MRTYHGLGGLARTACGRIGHELESAKRILRHYIDLTADMADTAIDRMVDW